MLSETHRFSTRGALQGFDVIDDMFLTSGPGSQTKRLFEVEVLLHTPDFSRTYAASVTRVGTFNGSGRIWNVSIDRHGAMPDILFVPSDQADVNVGTVDLKSMLSWLVSQGVLSGEEYFNGMGTGVEVRQGAGSVMLDAFAVTYR